ncbi:hypothetical protein QR685DRAFT_531386 [Neurospora intermedia]|uniref:Uncharacterized protein n=1 Tax=Neurospora intermedia TaxID=5142 RepID=A0ABR3D678_NEUIN
MGVLVSSSVSCLASRGYEPRMGKKDQATLQFAIETSKQHHSSSFIPVSKTTYPISSFGSRLTCGQTAKTVLSTFKRTSYRTQQGSFAPAPDSYLEEVFTIGGKPPGLRAFVNLVFTNIQVLFDPAVNQEPAEQQQH